MDFSSHALLTQWKRTHSLCRYKRLSSSKENTMIVRFGWLYTNENIVMNINIQFQPINPPKSNILYFIQNNHTTVCTHSCVEAVFSVAVCRDPAVSISVAQSTDLPLTPRYLGKSAQTEAYFMHGLKSSWTSMAGQPCSYTRRHRLSDIECPHTHTHTQYHHWQWAWASACRLWAPAIWVSF